MIESLFWLSVGTIIYVYAGYPALLTLLARSRPLSPVAAAVSMSRFTPPVTLLIAAHNEEVVIADKLENSLALNYPADCLQILVAADGSTDRTAEIVRAYAARGVELSFSPPRQGKMAAINRAIARTRGHIVVFSDANNLYAPDVLHRLVPPFGDPTVGAVSGAKVIVSGDGALGEAEGLYWQYESFIKQQETRLGCCVSVAGEVLAIRHDLFEPPPDEVINDDFYMALRLVQRGYRVVYVADARSRERVSPTARDEVARRARIVAGRYQAMVFAPRLLPLRHPLIVWQVISHKFLRPLVPFAMIGAFLANLFSVLRPSSARRSSLRHLTPPLNWIILGLQLAFYGMAWLGNHWPRASKLLYLPTFLVNSNLAACLGLYRFATGRQTTLWQRVARRSGEDKRLEWE